MRRRISPKMKNIIRLRKLNSRTDVMIRVLKIRVENITRIVASSLSNLNYYLTGLYKSLMIILFLNLKI